MKKLVKKGQAGITIDPSFFIAKPLIVSDNTRVEGAASPQGRAALNEAEANRKKNEAIARQQAYEQKQKSVTIGPMDPRRPMTDEESMRMYGKPLDLWEREQRDNYYVNQARLHPGQTLLTTAMTIPMVASPLLSTASILAGEGTNAGVRHCSDGQYQNWGDMVGQKLHINPMIGELTNPGYLLGGMAGKQARSWFRPKESGPTIHRSYAQGTDGESLIQITPEQSQYFNDLVGQNVRFSNIYYSVEALFNDQAAADLFRTKGLDFNTFKTNYNRFYKPLKKDLTPEQLVAELPKMALPERPVTWDAPTINGFFEYDVSPRLLDNLQEFPGYIKPEIMKQIKEVTSNPFKGIDIKYGYTEPGVAGYSFDSGTIRLAQDKPFDPSVFVHEGHHSMRERLGQLLDQTDYAYFVDLPDNLKAKYAYVNDGLIFRPQYTEAEVASVTPFSFTSEFLGNNDWVRPLPEMGATAAQMRFNEFVKAYNEGAFSLPIRKNGQYFMDFGSPTYSTQMLDSYIDALDPYKVADDLANINSYGRNIHECRQKNPLKGTERAPMVDAELLAIPGSEVDKQAARVALEDLIADQQLGRQWKEAMKKMAGVTPIYFGGKQYFKEQ